MDNGVALHFRDQLRAARAVAHRNAEAFEDIVVALEHLGTYLDGRGNLGKFREAIGKVAAPSPMTGEVPDALPHLHSRFEVKYEIVREARNAAVHEGALARHLTSMLSSFRS